MSAAAPATAAEQRLWSVTTLIGAGLPKEALIYWAANVTSERAYDDLSILQAFAAKGQRDGALAWLKRARFEVTKKAAARGSALHAAAEQYALGLTPDVEEHVMPWVMQYRQFLTDFAPQFLAAEAPIYNLTERYAGTMDGVVVIDGQTVLLDVKTHAKDIDAKSRPPYPDVALQLVAYARAERVGVDPAQRRNYNGRRYYIWTPTAAWVPMPKLDGAVCLAISPTDYELVPVAIDDEVWEAFLHVRGVARWALQTSQNVLGPVIEPTAVAAPAAFDGAEPPIPGQLGLDSAAPEPVPFEGTEPPPAPEPAGTHELEGSDAEPPAFSGTEPPPADMPAAEPEPLPEPAAPAAEPEPADDGQPAAEASEKTPGEQEFEAFLAESSQADVDEGEGVYWERIANYLHENGPTSLTDLIKGTKSSQARIRALVPKLVEARLLVNKGTDGRPKWALKGADE